MNTGTLFGSASEHCWSFLSKQLLGFYIPYPVYRSSMMTKTSPMKNTKNVPFWCAVNAVLSDLSGTFSLLLKQNIIGLQR